MATDTLTRGERTRLAILEAAQELFLENGYQGTSMRQIAERAGGIAVGGIYNHFASKEDIFREIIEARSPAPRMVAMLEEAEGESGPELLADALGRTLMVAVEYIDFIQMVSIDIQEFDGATMAGIVNKMLPTIMTFAQRVMAVGGLRADVSPVVLMRGFVSLMIGFALTQRVAYPEGRARLALFPDMTQEAWADALVDVYLHGVAGEG